MTYANPYYDPEWKTTHDRHAVQRERAEADRNRLAETDAMLSDAYRQAETAFDYHHQACLASFKMQHATVQEYATWVFSEFKVNSGDWEGGIPIPQVDFAQLRTIEDVDAAWSRIHCIVSDAAAERRSSLPTGQPEGLHAFASAAAPNLTRTWRTFSPHELYPTGYVSQGETGMRTLMTVDEQDDGWHVCFMQNGTSVTNVIELLATAVYREAHDLAQRQTLVQGGLRGWLARHRATEEMLAPERFHFYQHLPPRGDMASREQFDRVNLGFRDGRYCEPEWVAYDVVPRVIQSARFDCAVDTSASGVELNRRLIADQRSAGDKP